MIGVRRFKTDEEALEYANASNFGLSSAVFGRDIEHALRIARGIVTGACHINGASRIRFIKLASLAHRYYDPRLGSDPSRGDQGKRCVLPSLS